MKYIGAPAVDEEGDYGDEVVEDVLLSSQVGDVGVGQGQADEGGGMLLCRHVG